MQISLSGACHSVTIAAFTVMMLVALNITLQRWR